MKDLKEQVREIFKQCFKKHVGIDDFGCKDCEVYVDKLSALFEKEIADRLEAQLADIKVKNAPEIEKCNEYIKSLEDKLAKAGKLLEEYFKCIQYVPMRAVDCDQDEEEKLRKDIEKLYGMGWKEC